MAKEIMYFEDIYENMELPLAKIGPITRQQLVDYASASGDYNKIHYDESFAKKAGLKRCIGHGMLSMAMVGSFLTDWAKGGILKSFKTRFSGIAYENDVITIKGKITRKFVEDNENFAEINVQSETQNNTITTQGSAIIKFESRNE